MTGSSGRLRPRIQLTAPFLPVHVRDVRVAVKIPSTLAAGDRIGHVLDTPRRMSRYLRSTVPSKALGCGYKLEEARSEGKSVTVHLARRNGRSHARLLRQKQRTICRNLLNFEPVQRKRRSIRDVHGRLVV